MSQVKATIGESNIDVVTKSYGRLEALISYCIDNGVALDFEETAMVQREIDDVLKAEVVNIKPAFSKKPTPKKVQVVIVNKQNLIDLALQETGGVEGLIPFMRVNGFSPNDDMVYDTLVKTLSDDVVNTDVRDFYKALVYTVNTGGETAAPPEPIPLTADSTEWTADSTEITADQTIY